MKWDELNNEQINALVHVHLMQKRLDEPCTDGQIDVSMGAYWCCTCGWMSDFYVGEPKSTEHTIPIPRYCENMTDAWLVVKHMDDAVIGIRYAPGELIQCTVVSYAYTSHHVSARTAPQAICKAALYAKGVIDAEDTVLVEVQEP